MTTITAELADGYAVAIRSSEGHTWAADEPVGVGGTDTAPNPYELLLGSLAACTSITVSMYAQRKGWSFEGIEVSYEHARIHADDCADCDDRHAGYLDQVISHVTIYGDLDDEQRTRLAQVAANCPVHKTLERGMHLVDEVVFA